MSLVVARAFVLLPPISSHRGGTPGSTTSVRAELPQDPNPEPHFLDDGEGEEDDDPWEEEDYLMDVPIDLSQLASNFTAIPIATTNVSYFYLRDELGLSEETLWKITYEAPSALGMTTQTIRHKVNVLRDALQLTDTQLQQLIATQPSVLHLSADQNMGPTLFFLLRALNLGRDELAQLILAAPALLTYNTRNLQAKIHFFTRILGLDLETCRELWLKEPKLVRCSVRTSLVPKMRFFVRELEMDRELLKALVFQHPPLFLYSLDDTLVPKLIYYLIMTLGMTTTQVHRVLLAFPAFLSYNLDRHIGPLTKYLTNDVEVDLQSMILKFPKLLSLSLPKVKRVVGYLRYELGWTAPDVRKILGQAPQVLSLSVQDNLAVKVDLLRGYTSDVRALVVGMPSVLLYSQERNLRPKLDYLQSRLGDRLEPSLKKLPSMVGYSLEKRIRPRLEALVEIEDPGSITVALPMTQAKYETWVRRKRARWTAATTTPSVPPPPPPNTSERIAHWRRGGGI